MIKKQKIFQQILFRSFKICYKQTYTSFHFVNVLNYQEINNHQLI